MNGIIPINTSKRQPRVMKPLVNDDLEFNSDFEEGNLDLVLRQKNGEYDLFMRTDSNTRGHHQWFYFSVKNKRVGTYKFNIMNFTKCNSLYQQGMRVAVYSTKKASLAKKGGLPSVYTKWHRGCDNISYNVSRLSSDNKSKILYYRLMAGSYKKVFYALTFEYTFEYSDDRVYFAYSVPYTYSDLLKLLGEVRECCKNGNIFFKEEVLCRTLSGINVPILTITSIKNKEEFTEYHNKDIDKRTERNKLSKKSVVIVTARIHPGETYGSFMMEGFLRSITSSSFVATQLRKDIIFKVIPMLNIDGVIIGNYRACLSGQDLNRQFSKSDSLLHPVVCEIKQLIRNTHSEGRHVLAYFDMHAHSKKKSIFIYGPHYPLHSSRYLKVRVFAKLLAENMEMFRYKACKFREEKEKLSAARLVIAREFNIINSFTIEASFHGFIDEERRTIEFTTELYELAGKQISHALLDYLRITSKKCIEKIQQTFIKKHKNTKTPEKYKQPTEVLTKRKGDRTILIAVNKKPAMIKKSITLKEIYAKIKEEIGCEEEVNSEDSDSDESEAEPLTTEEEAKTLKSVIDIVKEFNDISTQHTLDTNTKRKPKKKKVTQRIEFTLPTHNRPKSTMKEKYIFRKQEELNDRYIKSIPSTEILPFNSGDGERKKMSMNSSSYPKVISAHMEFPTRNKLKDTFSVNYWRRISNLLYSRMPNKERRFESFIAKAPCQKYINIKL